MTVRAVVFDLGGVVLSSPLAIIEEFERAHGVPTGTITSHVGAGGASSAWHGLETGRISMDTFVDAFEAELRAEGWELPVADLMQSIERKTEVRSEMVGAIQALRTGGFTVAALTNNWEPFPVLDELRDVFDLIVESVRVGVNKPDEAIYEILLAGLEMDPRSVVYLDDIGRNLKPARRRGMTTIKVDDSVTALRHLSSLVGLDLV